MRKMQLNYTTLVATCPVTASNGKKKMVRCFLTPLQDVKGELSLKICWKKKKKKKKTDCPIFQFQQRQQRLKV
jgi:hypothetical protein